MGALHEPQRSHDPFISQTRAPTDQAPLIPEHPHTGQHNRPPIEAVSRAESPCSPKTSAIRTYCAEAQPITAPLGLGGSARNASTRRIADWKAASEFSVFKMRRLIV